MNQPPRCIFVRTVRRDGKLDVTYVFPVAGTRLRKIITREKLEAERAAGYRIEGVTQ